jgi:HD superfamily phosphodiesterase
MASAAVDSYTEWLASVTAERDLSHGLEHFLRVRDLAMELARETQQLGEKEVLVLELSALSHDLLDHKYVIPERVEELRKDMLEALQARAGLSSQEALQVDLIASNVSLSKELRGELRTSELEDCCCLHLRNLVSDADKLDALGKRGLARLAQYQTHLSFGSSAMPTVESLRKVAEEHLLHRSKFLRTSAARERGRRLQEETLEILKSDREIGLLLSGAQKMVAKDRSPYLQSRFGFSRLGC